MRTKYSFLTILIAVFLLSACGGSSDTNITSSEVDEITLTTPTGGRLLASQCAQCHGTDGISVSGIDSLAGESGEILEEMFEMKGESTNSIMHLQAKGYSDSEIREIANYFSTLYQGGGGIDNDDNDDREGDDD